MFKFKVGDEVIITVGKDKGKKSKVEKVYSGQNKLIVSGVNLYKRHKKVSRNQPAGIYEIPRAIDSAKVAIVCPKCGKVTRIGFKIEGNTKIRICRRCKGSLAT